MELKITETNFEAEVKMSSLPVLVDFYADWCGPCKMIAPIVDEIATEFAGKAKVCKLNVDDCGRIAQSYGVMSIPTLIVFKGGKETERVIGFRPKSELAKLLQD